MKRKYIIIAACGIIAILASIALWNIFASSTHIAFVNYQAITLSQIAHANNNSYVKIYELNVNKLDDADHYDMVMVNGMGLKITDEQRQALIKAAEKGTPILTTAATNPQNYIVSVDSVDTEFLKQYLAGGRNNYRNMLNYIRKFIDGKKLFASVPDDPVRSITSLLYYPTGNNDKQFQSVEEYEAFLKQEGKWHKQAPRIILTGQMGVADSLVANFERAGTMIYPVNNIQQFVTQGHADSIHASAMINMAHGRMGDRIVHFLDSCNIPLFSPLNVNRNYSDWMNDKMGMNGGFMSQSIVTPEIDGALLPYSLFAQFEEDEGMPYIAAIPDRLSNFISTVNNYINLRNKPNKDKRIAIFYFKGPGQNSLVAEGMNVVVSLFNLLEKLKFEGYSVDGLPSSAKELEMIINEHGCIFNDYAVGAKLNYITNSRTEKVSRDDYDRWCTLALSTDMRHDIDEIDGEFPGHGLTDGHGNLAMALIRFGNVVLIPQTAAGLGDDEFKIVHGTDAAPPHQYVASYLWTRYGFNADALMHFGAHGSLEFTPRKQVALGSTDWSDRLVGNLPHIYVYSTSNVGEAMIAKRRSYACIVNYLTPPFIESGVRGIYKNLTDAIATYNKITSTENPKKSAVNTASLAVKKYTLELGIHRELRLDSVKDRPYNLEDIARIENFAEELTNEKITGALYVVGKPYTDKYLYSTIKAMTIDPIAYSLRKLHSNRSLSKCREKASAIIDRLLLSGASSGMNESEFCRFAGITQHELDSARFINHIIKDSKDILSRMMVMGTTASTQNKVRPAKIAERQMSEKTHTMLPGMSPDRAIAMAKQMGADENAIKTMITAMKKKAHADKPVINHDMHSSEELSASQIEFAQAVTEIEMAINNVHVYRNALQTSPEAELTAIVNALNGGYTSPTPGGDPVLNPNILPTGRNMFAVNAEETPSTIAWEKGKTLADQTIKMYRKSHNDSLPRKVSYTLWSSEFIETEGATIAQVLYMLGVEPIRDPFGRVSDLRLIPSDKLGRPRIDVVVQTSGQLRDIAASRLFLIDRAVKMAASADDKNYPNFVSEGAVESERLLVDKGVAPKEARRLATARVFGGINGNYGSGIQAMVEAGDQWDTNNEIAATYINNMGAMYGSEEDWEMMRKYAFEAALTCTDVIVQPRQSNTWGALSLDHVYEFMGGMNLAVRSVTGKEPEAYLCDYRNRNNTRMQEIKEAIGIESRTTLLNPIYIQEKMKGGAGDASALANMVKNTYGWNVMKAEVIDQELWNNIYDTYIQDKHHLDILEFFKSENPAAIEEITAIMLETARKGMWSASPEQISAIAELHTNVVNEFNPSCSGVVCNNAKLRNFIASNVSNKISKQYLNKIASIRAEQITGAKDGVAMKHNELNHTETSTNHIDGFFVAIAVLLIFMAFVVIARKHNRNANSI